MVILGRRRRGEYDIRRGRFWVEGKGLSKGGEKGKVHGGSSCRHVLVCQRYCWIRTVPGIGLLGWDGVSGQGWWVTMILEHLMFLWGLNDNLKNK